MKILDRLATSIRTQEAADFRLRSTAATVHFSGTVLVAITAFFLIRLVWYPGFFWQIAGGGELLALICTVDAVLGPLLTFAVFNPAKGLGRLRFDLITIVSVQLVAFAYGLWTTASARPLFLAYSVDRFNLVTAVDIDEKDLQAAEVPRFRTLSWGQPQIIGTRAPKDAAEKLELIDSALAGRDRHLLPKTYVAFERVRNELIARVQPLSLLEASSGKSAELVKRSEARLLVAHPKLGFVPIVAKGEWVMVVDAATGELLEPLPVSGF